MTEKDGYSIVRAAVAKSFQVPVDDISPEQSLVNDLGADSLDFVELLFTLEESFEIEFEDSEATFLSQLDITSPEVVQDGFLTAEALGSLRPLLPSLETLENPDKVTPAELYSLITVQTLWIMVQKAMETAEA